MNKKPFAPIIFIACSLTGCRQTGNEQPKQTFIESFFDQRVTAGRDLEVNRDWQEIKLLRQIKSSSGKTYQRRLLIKIEGQQLWKVNPEEYIKTKDAKYWEEHPPEYIENSQGQPVKIDVELIDETGKSYKFITETGSTGEISFGYDYSPQAEELPADHYFTKLRIRSSIPFKASELLWTQDKY